MPLYHQVEQVIRHRIAARQYAAGAQIPAEHELGRELGVSRVTIREALRELVRERVLVKLQGRGTFVASRLPPSFQPTKYNGFLEDLYDRVRQLEVVNVEMSRQPLTATVRTALSLPAAASEMVVFKRLRHSQGEPFSFTVNYLPLEIGQLVNPDLLTTVPINTVFERDLKIPILGADETIEAAAASPEVAARLGIPVLYPVMHVTRVMFTRHDRAFEVVESFYRADKYQYCVSLSRVKRAGKWRWGRLRPGADTANGITPR